MVVVGSDAKKKRSDLGTLLHFFLTLVLALYKNVYRFLQHCSGHKVTLVFECRNVGQLPPFYPHVYLAKQPLFCLVSSYNA